MSPSLSGIITAGCVNFESVPRDQPATLDKILTTLGDAAGQGCDLVVCPELALKPRGTCDLGHVRGAAGWPTREERVVGPG
jgi:predicted amidohydrolase